MEEEEVRSEDEWSHVASVHGSPCPPAPGLEEEGGGERCW